MAPGPPPPRPLHSVLMNGHQPPPRPKGPRGIGVSALVTAARGGDEIAFRRLLHDHQGLVEQQVARFYLPWGGRGRRSPGGADRLAQAINRYRADRGATFATFAAMCMTRRLSNALATARRGKHQVLTCAVGGEQAEQAWANICDGSDPTRQLLAREQLAELRPAAERCSPLEREALAHHMVGFSRRQAAHRGWIWGRRRSPASRPRSSAERRPQSQDPD